MVDEGKISKKVYSLLSGPNNSSDGNLLFGEVDHSNYEGTLHGVKMVKLWGDGHYSVLLNVDGFLGKGFHYDADLQQLPTLETPSCTFPEQIVKQIV